MQHVVGLIADIVRSRELDDRAAAQDAVRRAFDDAHRAFSVTEPVWATVGDEFQATYSHLHQALSVTALVRLLLPDDLDCRFGLGQGEIRHVERAPGGGLIQDGSAWWSAREAIKIAHKHEDHGHPYLRTWFDGGEPDRVALVNAYLISRDHSISRMKHREKRVTAAALLGDTQEAIARSEQITQSAVSQNLRRSGGAALMLGLQLLSTEGES